MHGPRIETMNGLGEIAPAEWNALAGASHPFVSHAWLHALEASGSANTASGWEAAHLSAHDNNILAGVLPRYRKFHSWGEFVFDFAWADACQRAGLNYYPKYLTAIPFTPVAGPRLLGQRHDELIAAGMETMRHENCLSWHVLFPEIAEQETWRRHGFLERRNLRFVWQDANYGDFEGFLAALKHKRRKEIRRERRQVAEAGVSFRTLGGNEIDSTLLAEIYRCYESTYLLRGQTPYLTLDFFRRVLASMPHALVVFTGQLHGRMVAAAICLRDAKTLYGRWWGSLVDVPGLHFEACYYQGIAYCLEHGLGRYDPGVQGEHKVARGFAPETSDSMHLLLHPELAAAVHAALRQETRLIEAHVEECRQRLPFRDGD